MEWILSIRIMFWKKRFEGVFQSYCSEAAVNMMYKESVNFLNS